MCAEWSVIRSEKLILALLNFDILFRPTQAGTDVILDDEPAGLLHALKFYSKAFALSFMILMITSRFKLYEGDSEWRTVIQFAVQLTVAITIVYVVCLALPDRIPLFRLIQAALYVDGVYIVTFAVVSIPISYLSLIVPSENRELDIFATEYEHCLSHNSILYWLLRGDLKYFLYSDVWKPGDVGKLVP